MEIKTTRIGSVDQGIDGSDQYILLERKDDHLTPEQAIEWLLPRVYREGRGPGSAFTHTVRAVQVQYSKCQVICTIEHRFDV